MTQHDDIAALEHMLEHALEAVLFTRDRVRGDLQSDRKLFLSLTRLVEIVGEAAARVSASYRAKHPEIPWSFAIGMRARLAHGYDKVDLDVLWETATTDLPDLIKTLEGILKTK